MMQTLNSDKTHFEKMGDVSLTRYVWRARKIYPNKTELRVGNSPFYLECNNITPPDTIAEDIDEMIKKTKTIDNKIEELSEKIVSVDKTTQKVEKDGKTALKYAILGTVLAIIGIILTFGIELYHNGEKLRKETHTMQPQSTGLPQSK